MPASRRRSGELWVLLVPTLLFLPVAAMFGMSSVDVRIAQHLFFDPAAIDFPARHAVWSNAILHTGGRLLIWSIGLVCLLLCALGYRGASRSSPRFPRLHAAR